MKKILVVSEIFPPQHGGSGRWFWEIYRRFPKGSVSCFVGNRPESDQTDRTFPHLIVRGELASREWGIRSMTGLKFYLRTWKKLVKLAKKESIKQVHCGRVLPEGFAALLLKLTHRVPYTCYVHGEDVETALTSRELKFLTGQVMHYAERIVANSNNSKQILTKKWNLPDHKVTVMTPGVDIEKFRPAPSSSRPEHWVGKKVILTVGRLQKRKGQDMMIKSLRELSQTYPNIHYCIVGDGEEKERLHALAEETGVVNHVEFAGELDDLEMVSRYQHCDVFALPNRRIGNDDEGFGMVLLEAQACGRPVLAGQSGGTSETMLEGVTGVICDCTAPHHIADKFQELLAKPDVIDDMGRKGREYMEQHFSWPALSNIAKNLYGD